MEKVRHVLGISGGKDSAALAIYMRHLYPEMDVEYYTCDTGRELDETYALVNRLESELGKSILTLDPVDLENTGSQSSFDYYLDIYGGYLPSQNSRWCTKKLKLDPFEKYVSTDQVISYVGIRGDEDRDGYISRKSNIQAIFPFRKNIWSEDVLKLLFVNSKNPTLVEYYEIFGPNTFKHKSELVTKVLSDHFTMKQKVGALLDFDVKEFNKVIFEFLKTTDLPVGKLDSFPLIENDDVIIKDDVFNILKTSGVGIPEYYNPVEFSHEGQTGTYSRSRSGCFFCFYQQKIEWVWLLENHPELYEKAIAYEKDGYSWQDSETLVELKQPERVAAIKKEYLKKVERAKKKSATNWQDAILAEDDLGCASCFV